MKSFKRDRYSTIRYKSKNIVINIFNGKVDSLASDSACVIHSEITRTETDDHLVGGVLQRVTT